MALDERLESRASRWAFWLGVALVLLTRLPFLPPTLEDIDSANFARALEKFDPALHHPHPPGYPIYVALGKALSTVFTSPPKALAVLSALAQAALLPALLALFRSLGASLPVSVAACVLTLTNPTLWFNGARPMSDSVGLLFIVATQAYLLRSRAEPNRLGFAALLTGLAPGVRLQSVLLTAPLLLLALVRNPGRRLRALALVAVGVLAWLLPLIVYSGGWPRYVAALGDTLGQAAASEPLLSDFTLNRAARAAALVLVSPWAEPSLGGVALGLSLVGALALAARSPERLGLALLGFLPYLGAHAMLQHVDTVRYSLPYLPLFGLLSAEGLLALCQRAPSGASSRLFAATTGALALWAAAITLPPLAAYGGTPSPAYLALHEIARVARPPEQFAVGAHFIFLPFVTQAETGVETFSAPPGAAVKRLFRFWREGGAKEILFVADPRRTDLESIDPRARRSMARWQWPFNAGRFLAGARPSQAELVRIGLPGFFAGEGFLLSLEAGKVQEAAAMPERRAYLKSSAEPMFLMVSGEPIGPAAQHTLEIAVDGLVVSRANCGEPLLQGVRLPPDSQADRRYRELVGRTVRGGATEAAPFVLRGLDYAPVTEAGFVPGSGWFYPEKDEKDEGFRWISTEAKALAHVPQKGARLVILGTAPIEYVGAGGALRVLVNGEERSAQRLDARSFRVEMALPPSASPFQEIEILTERVFVPDRHQWNGDRRRLAVRVYAFRLEPS